MNWFDDAPIDEIINHPDGVDYLLAKEGGTQKATKRILSDLELDELDDSSGEEDDFDVDDDFDDEEDDFDI